MEILVGFTGSLGGQDALALGKVLAESGNKELKVCTILHKDKARGMGTSDGGWDKVVQEQVVQWMDEAEEKVGLPPTVCTIHYAAHPSEGLIEVAEHHDADCLVISGGRHGALGKITLGSLGNSLIHSSPVPLALAPRGYRNKKIKKISRLTVGIGNLDGTDRLIRAAIRIARDMDIDVRVMSLMTLPAPGAKKTAVMSHDEEKREIEKRLNYIHSELPSDLSVTTELGKGHTIADAVENMDWLEDEIVLISSARLGAPTRLFLGNIANKILRNIPVPLIIVPRHDREEVTHE